MTPTLIVFAASALAIIAMVAFKYYELSTGKRGILTRVSDKTNHRARAGYRTVRLYLSYINKRNAVLLLQFILDHIVWLIRKVQRRIHTHIESNQDMRGYNVLNLIKGKGIIKKRGAVSFFLKQVGEDEELKAE